MNSIEDIINLIAKRDGISYNEAAACVHECQEEISYIMADNPTYEAVADCIADVLGLEPDYMEILMPL